MARNGWLVPVFHRDLDFFDRQRDLFPDWAKAFDDSWKALDLVSSRRRFDEELQRVQKELHDVSKGAGQLQVKSPFVTDASGNRKFALRFDCSKYKPEEITVKTMDNKLCVHAKHDEEGPGRKVHSEFTQEYVLPDKVEAKALHSTLTKDGVLQIEAPAPPAVEAPKENLVPIEYL